MVAQNVKSKASLIVGDIVEETGAIYAGTLPTKKPTKRPIKVGKKRRIIKKPQKTGIFVVLPSDDSLVCSFNDLSRVAQKHNSAVVNYERWNKGDGGTLGTQIPQVQIPSIEIMQTILENSNKGELGIIFNKHGLNSDSFPQGYIWTSTPGEVIGEHKKIEGNKTDISVSHTMHQAQSSNKKVFFPCPKWTKASGVLAFFQPV